MNSKLITILKEDGTIFQINLNKKDFTRFCLFNSNYILETEINTETPKTLRRAIKTPPKCRFCNKSAPLVTFKEKTHVVPQQWNRPKLLSDFECDSCNKLFSKYESDFGHYFLIERILSGNKKKKGNTKYNSEGGTTLKTDHNLESADLEGSEFEKLKEQIISENKSLILISQGKDEVLTMLPNGFQIEAYRKPHRPINVFKVFLKIGISLIKEEELHKYSRSILFLQNEINIPDKQEYLDPCFNLFTSEIPIWKNIFKYPICQLYQQKKDNQNIVSKILAIYIGNQFFHIPILSDLNIEKLRLKENVNSFKVSPYNNPYLSKTTANSIDFMGLLEKTRDTVANLSRSRVVKNDVYRTTIIQDGGPIYYK